MVSLKFEEIEYLTDRANRQLDTNTFYFSDRIFVTLNVGRNKLTPYLKWRMDKAKELYESVFNKGHNYKLVFELTGFKNYDLIAESLTLTLVNFDDASLSNVFCKDGIKPFSFFVSKSDLDRYFKRYYSTVGSHRTNFYTDENGVLFGVLYDYARRVTKIVNMNNLLVGMKNEPKLSAIAYCHDNDEFDEDIGLEVAHKKWTEKWGAWFKGISNCRKSILKTMEEQDEYTRLLKECQEVADVLNAQTDEIENQTNVEENEDMQVTITDTKTGAKTVQVVKPTTPNYNYKDYIDVLNQVKGKDLIGVEIGDYVITDTYADSSKHKILVLWCKHCGSTIETTKNMIKRGKVNLKCPLMYSENEIADYMSDSDNYTKDTVFVTGLKSDLDGDDIPSGKTEAVSLKGNVLIKEIHRDLFDAPAWSYIAHCIPGDLSFGGVIARKIDELWDMQYKLDLEYDVQRPGVALVMDNVFNLIASPRKYTKAEFSDIEAAVQEMAITCWDLHVCLLSMPKIGCGANGLDWNEVKPMIEQVFVKTFSDMNIEHYGTDKDNYRNIEIDVCLGE